MQKNQKIYTFQCQNNPRTLRKQSQMVRNRSDNNFRVSSNQECAKQEFGLARPRRGRAFGRTSGRLAGSRASGRTALPGRRSAWRRRTLVVTHSSFMSTRLPSFATLDRSKTGPTFEPGLGYVEKLKRKKADPNSN